MTDDDGPSGAFVARIWHDPDGLRARIRHTADVRSDSCGGDEVTSLRGPRDHVIGDLVDRFHGWAVNFAGGREGGGGGGDRSPGTADGLMTPE